MSKDKREPDYPPELETHFILRLPEEPAKQLRDVLKSGENLKNRLTIQMENDMRSGEVRFDNWLMHAKIVDLPTITESLKTIDNKSFYKCADICQMMVCKLEPDQPQAEEESSDKKKKKDPNKVDKKFLFPHGITPPTKNVRKRRFRKTLKKKCVEAPEIEKEVKRLLRADNEAVSFTWELVNEEDEQLHSKTEMGSFASLSTSSKPEKKSKAEKGKSNQKAVAKESSNVVDIFGGAVSDSEEENVQIDDHLSVCDSRLSDTNSVQGVAQGIGDAQTKETQLAVEFDSNMFQQPQSMLSTHSVSQDITPLVSGRSGNFSSEEEIYYSSLEMSKDNMQARIDHLQAELEELKLRKQKTQHEIAGMENLALQQRFQDILHTLNQDIMYKDMEYQGLLVLQNSEVI